MVDFVLDPVHSLLCAYPGADCHSAAHRHAYGNSAAYGYSNSVAYVDSNTGAHTNEDSDCDNPARGGLCVQNETAHGRLRTDDGSLCRCNGNGYRFQRL
jgi:hypothetical protein